MNDLRSKKECMHRRKTLELCCIKEMLLTTHKKNLKGRIYSSGRWDPSWIIAVSTKIWKTATVGYLRSLPLICVRHDQCCSRVGSAPVFFRWRLTKRLTGSWNGQAWDPGQNRYIGCPTTVRSRTGRRWPRN